MPAALPTTSFSLDHVASSLRFDGKAPHKISRAGPLASQRVSPCLETVERGTCNEALLKYYYDVDTDRCRPFYYSGCDGNGNNFATLQDCEKRCKIGEWNFLILFLGIIYSNFSGLILTTVRSPASPTTVAPGTCPNGRAPLGDQSPVLCGNKTDSIGCPSGYYCRAGPPDVCCPEEALGDDNLDLQQLLNQQLARGGDVRRKPFINDEQQSTPNEETKSTTNFLLTPATMCPDGSDALLKEGSPVSCGSGFDGHLLCPRGYYCSIDPERNGKSFEEVLMKALLCFRTFVLSDGSSSNEHSIARQWQRHHSSIFWTSLRQSERNRRSGLSPVGL